jgi:hypothetical protein
MSTNGRDYILFLEDMVAAIVKQRFSLRPLPL